MPLLDHAGNAIATQLNAGISNTDLSFVIVASTGWPTGGANGKFYVTINRGNATEERILVNTRSGTTCSIAALGDRGKDGTSAVAHTAGESVEHTFAADEAHDNNQHIYTTTRDDHTQYMKTDGTRHDLTARHSAGSVIPTAAPTTITPDASAAEGAGTTLARSSHVHAISTIAPVAIGTALAEGAGNDFARATHVHTVGVGAINASNMFAADVVDSAAIIANAIGTSELADNSVDTGAIINLAVTLAKLAHEAPTAYTPRWEATGSAPSIGNGTLNGHYIKAGRIVIFRFHLTIGSTTGKGSGIWKFGLPDAVDAAWNTNNTYIAALGGMNNSGTEFVALVRSDDFTPDAQLVRLLERVTLGQVGTTSPFTWDTGDFLTVTGAYISAT